MSTCFYVRAVVNAMSNDDMHDDGEDTHPSASKFSPKWLSEDDWNEWATCPHCGDREDDIEELGADLEKDGKWLVRQCGACGKKYGIMQSVTWFWKTDPLVEDVRSDTE